MHRAAVVGLVALCCALAAGAPVVPDMAPIPWTSVLALLPQMAGSPGADRGTLALALNEFMNGLVAHLATHGAPAHALGQIQDRFASALNAFLSAGPTASAFGEDVARLARELQALATQGGVQGVPAALLERIGIATWAVDALRHRAQEMTWMQVADIARQIAGQALANGRAPGLGVTGLPPAASGDYPAIPQPPTPSGAGNTPPIPPIPTPPTVGGPPWQPGPPLGVPPVQVPPEEDPPPPRRGR